MIMVQPSAQLVTGYENRPEELIELCGRICYDSQDKIEPGSAEKFCEKLRKSGHTSVFEHANIVLKVSKEAYTATKYMAENYEEDTGLPSFLRFDPMGRHRHHFVSGNARAWDTVMNYMSKTLFCSVPSCVVDALGSYFAAFDTVSWKKRLWRCHEGTRYTASVIAPSQLPHWACERHTTATFFIICDRGISHELVRHRTASFSQQSTRYCKANKDDGIKYVMPSTCCADGSNNWRRVNAAIFDAETRYEAMLKDGASPQIARAVLPTCLATKLYMTMTIERWRDFLKLRLDPAAHPDMRVIAEQIQQQLFPKEVKS